MAIPTRIDVNAYTTMNLLGSPYTGGGVNYIVETPTGVIYMFVIDVNTDPGFIKSLDGGITWGTVTVLKNINCTQLSIWYDRWTDPTGVLGDLIHVVYTDFVSDDVFYRTINTASGDALGTERTVFAGSSTASGGAISIARMIGGNIIVAGSIDAGAETYAYKSNDYFATSTAIANPYEASPDKLIMMPGWAVDTQDAMCFYYDNSGTEISVKYYDDSGDSWSETSIATSITHPDHTSLTLGHWSATVDHANSQNLLAFWTAVDAANADLRVFKVTQSAQTETGTNCVLDSTDDQAFCGISISGSSWYVFYLGKSNGTELYGTADASMNIYYKLSTDGGVNWGSETKLSNQFQPIIWLMCTKPIYYKSYGVMTFTQKTPSFYTYNAPLAIPHSTFQLGI